MLHRVDESSTCLAADASSFASFEQGDMLPHLYTFLPEAREMAVHSCVSIKAWKARVSEDGKLCAHHAGLHVWADDLPEYEHVDVGSLRSLDLRGSVIDAARAMDYFRGVAQVGGFWVQEVVIQGWLDEDPIGEDDDSAAVIWESALVQFVAMLSRSLCLSRLTVASVPLLSTEALCSFAASLAKNSSIHRLEMHFAGDIDIARHLAQYGWQADRRTPGVMTRACSLGCSASTREVLLNTTRRFHSSLRTLHIKAASAATESDEVELMLGLRALQVDKLHPASLGSNGGLSSKCIPAKPIRCLDPASCVELDPIMERLATGYRLWLDAQPKGQYQHLRGEQTRAFLYEMGRRWREAVPENEKRTWKVAEARRMQSGGIFELLMSPNPRYQFEYTPYSTMMSTLVTGVQASLSQAQERFHSYWGPCPSDLVIYITVGHGPKVFGVKPDGRAWYHYNNEWLKFNDIVKPKPATF